MEEKKFDLNSIIGFVLIFGILIWIMYQNQPSDKEIAAEKAKKELVAKQEAQAQADKAKTAVLPVATATAPGDTVQLAQLQKTLGSFAYSATLPSAKEGFTTIENEKMILKYSRSYVERIQKI
jgi:YidC/Oxa1 family membrane protein insertase